MQTIREIILPVLIIIVILAAIGTYMHWLNQKDAAQNAVYTAYENCVKKTYHMTAAAYYQQTGELPECV